MNSFHTSAPHAKESQLSHSRLPSVLLMFIKCVPVRGSQVKLHADMGVVVVCADLNLFLHRSF